ncbi:MAG TPA: dehydrogenase [Verrucomicrobiales bacterium]|nr:dehydrogenase [Verrucomicrobiales bacterium]
MNQINRRKFIQGSAVASAGALFASKWSAFAADSSVRGANEEIRCAVVGFKGRGQSHIDGINKLREQGHKVRVTALCDVDSQVLAKGAAAQKEKTGDTVETYEDIRDLLESRNVDAVMIATPNHWHALGAIWSIQAGKDVYLEKPVSHNVWEGRQIVNAARKYKKIVQTGTQSRSSHAIRDAVQWIKDGNLGKITIARGMCYKPRNSIGRVSGPQEVPDHINYDLWLGPAEMTELTREKLHYDWHWVWATGNGDLGNQGIHQMDIARWFLGEMELSPRVWSVGGRLGYVDDGETANTQIIYHDYARAPLIFEVRGLPEKKGAKNMDKFMGGSVAVVIHCEGGHVFVPSYTAATAFDKGGMEIKSWKGADDHYENWIKAVRSRKVEDLTADILEGHLSSALCHTGNISHRIGSHADDAKIRGAISNDLGALETYERMVDHLKANEVDLLGTPLTLGADLQMNPKSERFTNNRKANRLLTRDYRKPFVVPKKV